MNKFEQISSLGHQMSLPGDQDQGVPVKYGLSPEGARAGGMVPVH